MTEEQPQPRRRKRVRLDEQTRRYALQQFDRLAPELQQQYREGMAEFLDQPKRRRPVKRPKRRASAAKPAAKPPAAKPAPIVVPTSPREAEQLALATFAKLSPEQQREWSHKMAALLLKGDGPPTGRKAPTKPARPAPKRRAARRKAR